MQRITSPHRVIQPDLGMQPHGGVVIEQLEDRVMLTLLGQQLYPSDYPWNQRITQAPVAANSTAIINAIVSNNGSNGRLHPDFGQDNRSAGVDLHGIPYNVVHGNSTPKVQVVIDAYPGESDVQPAPIPANAVIEGDYQSGPKAGVNNRGDSHLLVWDEDNNVSYEFYRASRPSENTDGKWHADGEAVWDTKTNQFRPLGWTSVDAAGLSVLAGLVRPDEGLPISQGGQGVINHAIRFTLRNAVILDQFIYPASHTANPGNNNPAIQPPMGARFRLKASVDISTLNPQSKIIAQAMKDYGMIVADNGSNFFFTGASCSVDANNGFALTWSDSDIQDTTHGLKSLYFADFEVVNLTPAVSGLSVTSGTAGTSVTVTGQNFSGAAGRLKILFGGTAATSVNILDDGHVVAVAPAGSGTVDVRVQSGVSDPGDADNINSPIFGYGVSAISPADQFTYTSAVNRAPSTPTNTSPVSGSSGVALTPILQAGAFADPDTGDTHAASQWLVLRASDNTVVYDSGADALHKTSCPVPAGRLANSTAYKWQVRYQDNRGAWSAYSAATTFTTLALTYPDLTMAKPAGWSDKMIISTNTGDNIDDTGSPIYKDQDLYIDCAVGNIGQAGAAASSTYLFVDGVLKASIPVAALASGAQQVVQDYALGKLSAGKHTIKLTADGPSAIQESNEGNNNRTRTITVTARLPDLTLAKPAGWADKLIISTSTGDHVGSSTIHASQAIYLDMVVSNIGTAAAATSSLYVYIDGTRAGTISIPALAVGGQYIVNDYSIGKLAAGSHTLKVTADGPNAILESNEGNNNRTRTISVLV